VVSSANTSMSRVAKLRQREELLVTLPLSLNVVIQRSAATKDLQLFFAYDGSVTSPQDEAQRLRPSSEVYWPCGRQWSRRRQRLIGFHE